MPAATHPESSFPSESTVSLLKDLISIPSVNPDGDPGVSEDKCCEGAVADYLQTFLSEQGAESFLEEVAPGRPNILATFPSDKPGKPKLLFGPHLDTVGVGNMTIPPFAPAEKEGKIFGRGASDTKGPMAAMLGGILALGEEIAELPYEIHFVGFASEESRQLGSIHFAKHHGKNYDFAIVGEPTEMKVVHTHKGCSWLTVDVPGTSVHGSMPELGDSAIKKASELVIGIESEFREELKVASGENPLLGHSTVNVGIIQGGTRANIVPNHCQLTIDIRATPELLASGQDPLARLQAFVQAQFPDAKVQPLMTPTFPLDTDPEHPIVQQLAQAGKGLAGAPWFCDAAHLAEGGLASIAMGPGSITQAHTSDEWIRVDELLDGVERFSRFLRKLRLSSVA